MSDDSEYVIYVNDLWGLVCGAASLRGAASLIGGYGSAHESVRVGTSVTTT